MNRFIIGSLWDRLNRNGANKNFEFLFQQLGRTNALLNEASEILKYAQKINEDNVNVKNMLDDLLINAGQSDAELVQARGDFDLLYKRLDSYNKQFEQTDFVELLKRYNKFGNMMLKKINTADAFELSVYNDKTHVTYQFMYNNDEYIIQTRVWGGKFNEVTYPYKGYKVDVLDKTGTWSTPTTSIAGYTEQIGATLEYSVSVEYGDSITVYHSATSRGGIFKATLNGGDKTKVFSTFGEGVPKVTTLFPNLDSGTHTIKLEFMGDDPNNPPSVSPSRGWTNNLRSDYIRVEKPTIDPIKEITYAEPSNKEFALNFKPIDGNDYFMIPFHGEPTAFKKINPVIKDGDKIVDISNMEVNEVTPLTEFKLNQVVYGRHPETPASNSLEITSTSMVDINTGILSFDGSTRVLEPIYMSNSYHIMGVARGDVFNRVLTSYGNQYNANFDNYATNIPMPEERDFCKSYMFLSTVEKNLATAFRFNDVKRTLRQGEYGKDSNPDHMTYLNNRSEAITKIYSRLFNSSDNPVPVGTVLHFSGDYIFAQGSNFHDMYSS